MAFLDFVDEPIGLERMGLLEDVIGLKEVKEDDDDEEEEDGLAVLLVVLPSNDAI